VKKGINLKNNYEIFVGDCLNVMNDVLDKSINLILCDLPYQKTKNSWDLIIDPIELWKHYERVIADNGAILLFGQDKFTAKMMLSNENLHRYNLIWEKTTPTGHLNAKKMPLRIHEDIMVFYKSLPTYNPQKTTGHPRKISKAEHKINCKETTNYGKHGLTTYDSTERYPKSVLVFATDKQKSSLHPTQKPVALLEYLIKTYSNVGDVVLDNAMGSGSTIIATMKTQRFGIGIEKDIDYFNIAKQRIETFK